MLDKEDKNNNNNNNNDKQQADKREDAQARAEKLSVAAAAAAAEEDDKSKQTRRGSSFGATTSNQESKGSKNKNETAPGENASINSKTLSRSDNDTSTHARPRRPRPLRPHVGALRRQAGFAATATAGAHFDPALVGMPIEAQIELAQGVLQPAGRVTAMPPRRPNYLPPHARGHGGFQPTTSLGATALTSSNSSKPNRYSWAQMQQWHAAQSAAAAAAAAAATGAGGGGGGGGSDHAAGSSGSLAGSGSGARAGGFHYNFSHAASRVLYVPNPIVNLSEHTKSRLVKIIEALKRFSEKWFSHVLLLFFLASYACLGAYIFISFEASNEQWEKQLIIDTRSRIVNETFDVARDTDLTRDAYVDKFKLMFEEYERLLNRVCASGMSSSSLENQWTFWGALFYSMTVFTTIGYGHLTPITFAGRVATMIYAIFGIPILLMVLADLGKLLTRIIKYAFKKFRYLHNKLMGRKASVRTRRLISEHKQQYMGVARHAFERGFATYIQPYQARLHTPFRDAVSPRDAAANDDAAAAVAADELQSRNPDQATGMVHSSDVLITPAKQTRPVSPKIQETERTKRSPFEEVNTPLHTDHHQKQASKGATARDNGKHANDTTASSSTSKGKHSQRSQSPAASASKGRKISTNNNRHSEPASQSQKKKKAALQQQQQQQQQHSKHSLSHSSSSANVLARSPVGVADTHGPANQMIMSSEPENETTTTTTGPQDSVTLDLSGQQETPAAGADATGSQVQVDAHQPPAAKLAEARFDDENSEHQRLDMREQEEEGGQGEEDDEGEELEEDDDLDIPVSFALFLLITYMMLGAVVFSIWESWNFFDSLYFVFISMSTIGFGDLVPQHPKRMIGTFAYLLFGLALTSMCINVVQEKIHATFLRAKMQIGEKMGFDLDQIMADDYYGAGEGGSVFDEDDEDDDDDYEETGSCGANSSLAAVSQTNNSAIMPYDAAKKGIQVAPVSPSASAKATVSQLAEDAHHLKEHNLKDQTAGVPGTTGATGAVSHADLAAAQKGSKSKSESLRLKKRSSGNSQDQQGGGGGSVKRKISGGSKRTSAASAPQQPQQKRQQQVLSPQQAPGSTGGMPLRSHLETIRMLNVPVMTQLDDSPASVAAQRRPASGPATSTTYREFTGGVRAFCEPLRRAFQTSGVPGQSSSSSSLSSLQRPRLQSSRSQPTSPLAKSLGNTPVQRQQTIAPPAAVSYQVNGSQGKRPQLQVSTSDAQVVLSHLRKPSELPPSGNSTAAGRRQQVQLSPSGGGGSFRLSQRVAGRNDSTPSVSRSLSSSRRASVSHELSQLDDLIVSLASNSSRPERFGPLLGIPATATATAKPRPSQQQLQQRGSHDLGTSQVAQIRMGVTPSASTHFPPSSSSAGFFYTNARRGTSMMVRPASAQSQASSTASKGPNKRSLTSGASSQTPPFYTPRGSSSHLFASNNSNNSNNYSGGSSHSRASVNDNARDHLPATNRRRESASSSSANSRMASARQSQRELNLSESQAALDELEAVKFSAACL